MTTTFDDLHDLAPLRDAPAPAFLWTSAGQLVWANVAAAAFLGASSRAILLATDFTAHPATAQIGRILQQLPAGASRLERLRLVPFGRTSMLTAQVKHLVFSDGSSALLVTAMERVQAARLEAVLAKEGDFTPPAMAAAIHPASPDADASPDPRDTAADHCAAEILQGHDVPELPAAPADHAALAPLPAGAPALPDALPHPEAAVEAATMETPPSPPPAQADDGLRPAEEPAAPSAALVQVPVTREPSQRAAAILARAARPLRFVWESDSTGHLTYVSREFVAAVGAKAMPGQNQSFPAFIAAHGADPAGKFETLFRSKANWSELVLHWPLADSPERAKVELSAVPIDSPDGFLGFRGFGMVRGLAEEPATQPAPPSAASPTPAMAMDASPSPDRPRERQLAPSDAAALRTIAQVLGGPIGAAAALPAISAEEPHVPALEPAKAAPLAALPPAAPVSEDDATHTVQAPPAAPPDAGEPAHVAEAEASLVPAAAPNEAANHDTPVTRAETTDPAASPPAGGDDGTDEDDGHAFSVAAIAAQYRDAADDDEPEEAGEEAPLGHDESDHAPAEPGEDEPAAGPQSVADVAAELRAAADGEPDVEPEEEPEPENGAPPQTDAILDLETPEPAAADDGHQAPHAGLADAVAPVADGHPVASGPAHEQSTPVEAAPEPNATGSVSEDHPPAPSLPHEAEHLIAARAEMSDPPMGVAAPLLAGALALGAAAAHHPQPANDTQAVPGRLTGPAEAAMPEPHSALAPPAPEAPEVAAAAPVGHDLDELRAREAELRSILDTATDGVLILSADGTVLSLNRSAEALFGIDAADAVGHPLNALLTPDSQRSASDYLDGLARNGVASVLNDGREVTGVEKNGGHIPLFMTIGRISQGGRGDKFCAVLRDITQWKAAERELVAARQEAELASQHKSDFLAKMSHEIRTPLNAIIGFSEMMMQERFGPFQHDRYRGYVTDIHAAGAHMMGLVNDLLDLSRIEAGKLELTFSAVKLADIVQQAVTAMQPQANREGVILRTSLPRVPPVVADPRSLRQILFNLLSNAIKFTRAGGQVIISLAGTEKGEVTLRVRDTGIGMNEKDMQAAMEPFRQIAPQARPELDGTGLGLPLTKALAEANRASFSIESAPEVGTLVQVTFPSTRVLAE